MRTATLRTVCADSPDRARRTSPDSLKPADINAASNCRATAAPSPDGPDGAGMRCVCRTTNASSQMFTGPW
ncbi:hypothetical protein GCM10010177_63100 [Actinomadura citrea]|nr:hypothetical protein GCM10010177_63100 [Actinomadura citrea]